jgi:Associated with zinc fingers
MDSDPDSASMETQQSKSYYNPAEEPYSKPRKRAKTTEATTSIQETATSNRFEVLSHDVQQPADDASIQANTNTPTGPRVKIPPIVIFGINDSKKLIDVIRDHVTDKQFFLVSRRDNFKLQLANQKDYSTIIKMFKAQNLQFHTFSNGDDKLVKFVIRGLPLAMDTDVIMTELHAQGYVVRTVSQMKAQTKEKQLMPLYAVTMAKASTTKKPSDIQYIYHHRVTTEPFHGKKGPTQCFRCQRFGHSSLGCHQITKCFKCAGPHESRDCVKSPDLPALCVNCNEAHPASSPKCEFFIRAKQAYQRNSSNRPAPTPVAQAPRRLPVARPAQANYSYANAANGNQQQQYQQQQQTTAGNYQQYNEYNETNYNQHQESQQYYHQPQETTQQSGKQDVWTSIEEIANTITRTEGIPPQVSLMIQMLIQLVLAQKPTHNGRSP